MKPGCQQAKGGGQQSQSLWLLESAHAGSPVCTGPWNWCREHPVAALRPIPFYFTPLLPMMAGLAVRCWQLMMSGTLYQGPH